MPDTYLGFNDENKINKRFRFVRIDKSLLPGGNRPDRGRFDGPRVVRLNLFDDVNLIMDINRVEQVSRKSYSVVGKIRGDEFSDATITISDDGIISGNVVSSNALYQIRYAGGQTHVIYDQDSEKFPQELEPIQIGVEGFEDDKSFDGSHSLVSDNGSEIDILVVYTSSARSAAGGTSAMETLIALAITETNTGYMNSGVSQRVRLAHFEEIDYSENSFNWSVALSRLRSTNDGYIDNVHALRDTYKADLVVMLVANSAYCGLAYLQDPISSSFESSGFSLVNYNCATGYYSFGHELGHNMGAHHDWYVNPSTRPFPHSHGLVNTNGQWRTIMAYNSKCSALGNYCTRVNYWSNPDVNYLGSPTGVAEGTNTSCEYTNLSNPACDSDNHKVLNDSALIVSRFRDSSTLEPPEKATLIDPTGTISDASPLFSWQSVSDSTDYLLWINDSSGNIFKKWYTADSITSGSICNVDPNLSLSDGDYDWWVLTSNNTGNGPWSDRASFEVFALDPPQEPTLIAPLDTVNDSTPTYSWSQVADATRYQLWVDDSNGNVIKEWYDGASVTSGAVCSITPSTTLSDGNHSWWVMASNAAGNSPWSAKGSFDVLTLVEPGKPTLINPSGSVSDETPLYSWNAVSTATRYQLWVEDGSGNIIKEWYDTSSVTSGDVCSVVPSVVLSEGSYFWWVRASNMAGDGAWSYRGEFSVIAESVPGKATLIAPEGAINDNSPSFSWQSVSDASQYMLWINDNSSGNIFKQWYSAGSFAANTTCSVNPGLGLDDKSYTWWVLTSNSAGYGPWSHPKEFDVYSSAPGEATLNSPGGIVTDNTPVYAWSKVHGATSYQLWVNDSEGNVLKQWYSANIASNGTLCWVTPTASLSAGDHTWWIRTKNTFGYGPWSAPMTFTVNP